MSTEYSIDEPLNREPSLRELISSFITPAEISYDRNHGPLPHIDPQEYTLTITGAVSSPLTLTLSELQSFPQHTITAALQCAGNRRHSMRTQVHEVTGIDWGSAAVSNCIWRGPLLADILEKAGGVTIDKNQGHVHLNSSYVPVKKDKEFGASIPLERCLDKGKKVILALEMNNQPLTPNHGFPVRAVSPGIVGARWTKWLDGIYISDTESSNYYQKKDYKILPENVTSKAQAELYWDQIPPLYGMPVNSVIAYPEPESVVVAGEDRMVEVGGYALPQEDDGPVVKVEVSCDGGKTWEDAEILAPEKKERETEEGEEKYRWSWVIWKHKVPREKLLEETNIWSRATDKGGNSQDGSKPWNLRGVAYNAYGETGGLKIGQE
ncbi:putative sulfite oxidase [Pyronema omphalodes]|nr:putative sulfite oxidase [Pyronema omphalodes]